MPPRKAASTPTAVSGNKRKSDSKAEPKRKAPRASGGAKASDAKVSWSFYFSGHWHEYTPEIVARLEAARPTMTEEPRESTTKKKASERRIRRCELDPDPKEDVYDDGNMKFYLVKAKAFPSLCVCCPKKD
eukprot:TRINITY_DN10456_c0_g1_i1.p1 TRINITY_DN10456_c0_g1~~TRINITY_DN10456_c0_g1_i1.p1  ORF type:complete len:131 (-),score=22.72 TRINITY_DN10456_c0_g1_i1:202-594(-)